MACSLVAPGASIGSLTVDGDFTLSGGTLDIEIGAGGDTDQLIVTNVLDVQDGVVSLSFLDGFLPNAGETFQFASGGDGVLFDGSGVSLVVSGVAEADFTAPTLTVDANGLSVTFNDALSAGTATHFFGSGRDDRFTGGSGDDTLTGGGGDDVVVVTDGGGADRITDVVAGPGTDDVLDMTAVGFTTFAEVIDSASQAGGDTLIQLDVDDSVILLGVSLGDLHPDDVQL